MGIQRDVSAALLAAFLLSGCNQSSGGSAAASTQAFASTQSPQDVTGQLTQATAGNWDLVSNQDGSALYVSTSSFHLLGNGRVAIAQKITGKASNPDAATIDIVEYDCSTHTQTMVATFGLDADGKVVVPHSRMFRTSDAPATVLSPGMVAWTALEPFCKAAT